MQSGSILAGMHQTDKGNWSKCWERAVERGLLWLPLLAAFIALTVLGWRSYRQVELYREWATQFDTAKYDPLAVAGLKGHTLTWGKPSLQGVQAVQSLELTEVESLQLLVDGRPIALPPDSLPPGKDIQIELLPQQASIPFTDATLAIAWCRKLAHILSTASATRG